DARGVLRFWAPRVFAVLVQQRFGCVHLFFGVDPKRPRSASLRFGLIVDALRVEKIAEQAGAGLIFKLADHSHAASIRVTVQAVSRFLPERSIKMRAALTAIRLLIPPRPRG